MDGVAGKYELQRTLLQYLPFHNKLSRSNRLNDPSRSDSTSLNELCCGEYKVRDIIPISVGKVELKRAMANNQAAILSYGCVNDSNTLQTDADLVFLQPAHILLPGLLVQENPGTEMLASHSQFLNRLLSRLDNTGDGTGVLRGSGIDMFHQCLDFLFELGSNSLR